MIPWGRLAVAAAEITLALVVFESASFLGLKATGMTASRPYAEDYRDALKEQSVQTLVPHPYFGAHLNPAVYPGANNYGFVSPQNYFFSKKRSNEFVIGILGGSVADFFARDAEATGFLGELSSRVPGLAGKRMVILNLSLPSSKQPQQFQIASYFLPMLDLAINLDGFNEVALRTLWYPPDYPYGYSAIYVEGRHAELVRVLVSAARTTQHLLSSLPLRFPRILGKSSAYRLIWAVAFRSGDELVRFTRERLQGRSPFPAEPGSVEAVDLSRLADVWERYAVLEDRVAREENVRAVFFLQPNQYASPGKPFSQEELEAALTNPLFRSPKYGVQPGYDALRARIPRMKRKGLLIFDLGSVFSTSSGTVYRDSCCHLTLMGERLLAGKIAAVLAQNSRMWLAPIGSGQESAP